MKESPKKFSVIVPFLNEEPFIEGTIRALLDQDFPEDQYELIFVDGGSADRSVDIVRSYPQLVLLTEEKRNIYAALNKGIRTAKGEITAFIGADCRVSRDWLKAIEHGMRDSGAALVLGQCCFPPVPFSFLKVFEDYENDKIRFVLQNCPKEFFYGYTNNMAVRAEVFRKVGFFQETPVTGDTEFVQRCVQRVPRIKLMYLPQMQMTHMEVTRLNVWLKKMGTYGRYNRLLAAGSGYRPLDQRTRWRIFRQASRHHQYSPGRFLVSFLVLLLGGLFYKAGEVWGAISENILHEPAG